MQHKAYEPAVNQRRKDRAEAAKDIWQQAVTAQIEATIQDVRQRLEALELLASEEQHKSPVQDLNSVRFSPFAKALLTRRDNLRSTLASLERQLIHSRRALRPSR